jgi:hypothetical protein
MKPPEMSSPGLSELPDHGVGEGRAKEDAELATARATTNQRELPAAGKPDGERRAEADVDAAIEDANATPEPDIVDAWIKFGGHGPMP